MWESEIFGIRPLQNNPIQCEACVLQDSFYTSYNKNDVANPAQQLKADVKINRPIVSSSASLRLISTTLIFIGAFIPFMK